MSYKDKHSVCEYTLDTYPRFFLFQHLHCGQHPNPQLTLNRCCSWLPEDHHLTKTLKSSFRQQYHPAPDLTIVIKHYISCRQPGNVESCISLCLFYDLMCCWMPSLYFVRSSQRLSLQLMLCTPGRSCPESGTANKLAPIRANFLVNGEYVTPNPIKNPITK